MRILPALLLCASLAAHADCGTEDGKVEAVEAFIFEHYEGWAFLSVSPQEDGTSFEVHVYPDVDYMMVCAGFVQVTSDCQVTSVIGTPLDNSATRAEALPCHRE